MSRTRREKNPDLRCNFQWDDPRHPECPHSCRYTVDVHDEDFHLCCGGENGLYRI